MTPATVLHRRCRDCDQTIRHPARIRCGTCTHANLHAAGKAPLPTTPTQEGNHP